MIATDEKNVMGHMILAIGMIGTGLIMFVNAATADGTSFIQYGAIGVLGACAIYVTTKLVPYAMHARQKETEDFLKALTTEREKLVTSMEKLSAAYTKELIEARRDMGTLIKDINTTATAERGVWAELIKESNAIHAKNYDIVREVATTLKHIKSLTNVK